MIEFILLIFVFIGLYAWFGFWYDVDYAREKNIIKEALYEDKEDN